MSKLAPVLLLSSLLLAILAQWILSYRQESAWVGVVGHGVALAFFAASLFWGRRRLPHQRPAWPYLAGACAIGLVGWAAYMAHAQHSYGYAMLSWLVGVVLAVVALLGPGLGSRLGLMVRRWKLGGEWQREALFVGLLFLVALALRLVGLAQIPELMLGDEGSMALEVGRILRGDLINPFGTGWFTHPNLFFYLEAAALRLFGWNLFGLRFTAALLGALGVPAVYFFAKGIFGRQTAWVSAFFLAGWGLPLQLSRLALNNSADPLLGALALGCLHRGLVRGRRGYFVASGLALGVSLYFYHGARLLLLVTSLALVLSGVRRLWRRRRGLLAFALVALLVAGPLLVYFAQYPERFQSRHETLDLLRSGDLATEQAMTGESMAGLLLKRLERAAFTFVYTPDHGYFYTPDIPMLYVFSGMLFVLGVGLALWHWREVRYTLPLAWIGLTIVFGGWLLRSLPQYQRYLIAAPAVCLLVGRAAVVLLRRAAQIWRWRPAPRRVLVLLVAVVLLVINAGYYFGVYTFSGAFSDRNTEIADRTARLMAELEPDYMTYFLGTTYMPLGGFNSVHFLAPGAIWMDVHEAPVQDWSFVQEGRGALFVILREREGELAQLRERFPGGEEERVLGRDGELLFVTYQVGSVTVEEGT